MYRLLVLLCLAPLSGFAAPVVPQLSAPPVSASSNGAAAPAKASCFERYRNVLIPGIPLLAGLTLALCILLLVMRKNRRTRRELEGQKALLDTFFALAPIGVAISGAQKGMRFLNQEFTRITG